MVDLCVCAVDTSGIRFDITRIKLEKVPIQRSCFPLELYM